MASGVAVCDECKTSFQEIKLGHKYRYVIFCLTEDLKQIVVEKRAEPSATYDEFLEELKQAESKSECRFAVFDAEFSTKDGQQRNKIVFFMWSPENSKIKQKMVYASSKDALKKALGEGIAKEIQANDHGDLMWSAVLDKLSQ
jgi:cofilin